MAAPRGLPELGGKNALVCDDADLGRPLGGALVLRRQPACASANRLVVFDRVYEFCALLVEERGAGAQPVSS
jgi:hypothetical protein